MAKIISERDQREREDLKGVLTDIFHDSPFSQEAIADMVGTSQPTISRWFSYAEHELPDLHFFSKLPVEILRPMCEHILKPHGLTVLRVTPREGWVPNGSIEDELLNVDVIQADIIRNMSKDPKKTLKHIREVINVCRQMEQEIVDRNQEKRN